MNTLHVEVAALITKTARAKHVSSQNTCKQKNLPHGISMSGACKIKIKIRFLKIHDYAEYATPLSFVFLPSDKVQNLVKVHLDVTCRCSTHRVCWAGVCDAIVVSSKHARHCSTLLLHVLDTCSTLLLDTTIVSSLLLNTTGVSSIPEMCPEENYRSEMDKKARKTVQS